MRKRLGLGLKLDIQVAQANLDEELQASAPKLILVEAIIKNEQQERVHPVHTKEETLDFKAESDPEIELSKINEHIYISSKTNYNIE